MKLSTSGLSLFFTFLASAALSQVPESRKDTSLLQPVEVNAVRAKNNTPVAFTVIDAAAIKKFNTGVDMPLLLNQTPSVQINSDAGNGIGYTGIRIRGTDPTRINVTLNGIPYNDAESQGTFWVNLPDLASSAQSIQIQRGVGSSTNGNGSFGGSIHVNTNETDTSKYVEFAPSYGSFNSYKATLIANTGLLSKHLLINGRISTIGSDGYVDRAKSRLQSFYTSLAWLNQNSSLRLNVFSGKEKTYAAWFGINQATLDTNRTYNPAGTEKTGTPYENESDNYTQTHYQAFYNQSISKHLKINVTGFLTRGKGYFEQYKSGQMLSEYLLPDYIQGSDTVREADLVRQLWLDNYFYGGLLSFQYQKDKTAIDGGFNAFRYEGTHFGKVIWTALPTSYLPAAKEWYRLKAEKNEMAGYAKWTQKISGKWSTYVDLQARRVQYAINGFRNNPTIQINEQYLFFNPKFGINYQYQSWRMYFLYARAAKEPNRDDFEAAAGELPKPEILNDLEAGWQQKKANFSWGVNIYYMKYKDQLVLTGKVNQVFAYTRTNIPESYRMGMELEGSWKPSSLIELGGNLTFSENKILNFTEYVDDYDNGNQQTKNYAQTDISFSPAVIASGIITFHPISAVSIDVIGKYVGKQFLDNTSNENRKINAYFTQDLRIGFDKEIKKAAVGFFIQLNNIFSNKYVANGYTFSYVYGGSLATENYYYPMATFHMMCGARIKLKK